MERPNLALKAAVIAMDGSLKNFLLKIHGRAGAERLTEQRLSRILHRRTCPTPEEQNVICWRLQRSVAELFGNGEGTR